MGRHGELSAAKGSRSLSAAPNEKAALFARFGSAEGLTSAALVLVALEDCVRGLGVVGL